jgi:hypothetical protein
MVEVSGLPCTVKGKAENGEGAHIHQPCIFLFFYVEISIADHDFYDLVVDQIRE